MNNITLYPELIDYIFGYCSKYYTDKEQKATWHYFAKEKNINGKFDHMLKQHYYFDKEVLALLEKGYQQFKVDVATRIFNAYKDELNLNLCPKCFKIARTPFAKQCRFCFHNWHESKE